MGSRCLTRLPSCNPEKTRRTSPARFTDDRLQEWQGSGSPSRKAWVEFVAVKLLNLKVPFGTAKFCRIRNARLLTWRDPFDVAFDDGIAVLEPHRTLRKSDKISRDALPTRAQVERTMRSGFFVHYDNGQTAEVSWSFIRELPPKNSKK